EITPLEFCLVELGVDVVMIEHEFFPEQEFEKSTDDEDQIGRIAGMDDVEPVGEENAPRQQRFPEERRGIFEQISEASAGIEWKRMAIDADAVDHLEARHGARALRADHRDY